MNLKASFLREGSFAHVTLERLNLEMYGRDVSIEGRPLAELFVAEMASVFVT